MGLPQCLFYELIQLFINRCVFLISMFSSIVFPHRRPVSITKCQSLSNFSLENLSVSDGEEGNTTDHSHSGTPDVVSTNTDERLDDKSDDLLSQGSEIPADPSDPTQLGSDGLSEKEAALRQVKTQLASSEHNYEASTKKTEVCVNGKLL